MPTATNETPLPGRPLIKYGRLTIQLLPQVYSYRVKLPMRMYPEWRVALEHSKVAIWYPDFGFTVRTYDLNIIAVGQPFSPENRIIHTTVNIMLGLKEIKEG